MRTTQAGRTVQAGSMMVLALLASGCHRGESKKEKLLDAAARHSHFEPPATMSRAEFGGMVERRFRALDRDGDGYLSPGEYDRGPERFRRFDANGDGRVSADEFSQAALRRFDRHDLNHDGTVTQLEWEAAHRGGHPDGG